MFILIPISDTYLFFKHSKKTCDYNFHARIHTINQMAYNI